MSDEIEGVIRGERRWTVAGVECFAMLQQLPSDSFDGLVTDPPYSSGGFTRGDRTRDTGSKYSQVADHQPDFDGDNRDQRGFLAWAALWLSECFRVLRSGAPVVLFTDWRQLPTMTDAMQAGGFIWRGIAPWTKRGAARPMMGRFRGEAEFLVWGSKGALPLRQEVGVLPGFIDAPPVPGSDRLHLTEKPVEVLSFATSIVPPGGLILDPFAGSGVAGVAAMRRGQRYLGFEISEHYARVARERIGAECSMSTVRDARAGQSSLFQPEGGS